jgi:hypothetical protein
METNPTEQRLRFLIDYASGQWSMSELCERYRVSRPTGYKWVRRVDEEGERGLAERSRRPKDSPHQTPAWIEQSPQWIGVWHNAPLSIPARFLDGGSRASSMSCVRRCGRARRRVLY